MRASLCEPLSEVSVLFTSSLAFPMKPISTSRSTFALSTSLLLLVLFTALPASAQLELDQGGNIGVGQIPDTQWKFNVEGSNSAVLRALYTGNNSNHAAVFGWAKPGQNAPDGIGIGGDFRGGHMALRAYADERVGANAYGLFARVAGASTANYGVKAYVTNGDHAYGLHADARLGSVGSYGLRANGQGALTNYGVFASAYGDAGEDAIGFYGYAHRGSTTADGYGVYGKVSGEWSGPGERFAGYFEGPVEVTGAFTTTSDARFKEAVESLSGESVLDRVLALEPKRYRYKLDALGQRMGFSDGERFGFIAQELEAVFPELVKGRQRTLPAVEARPEPWDGEGPVPEPVIEEEALEVAYKAVNYIDLIPVLVGAIQEQQAEIAALKAALGKLGVTVE